MAEMLLKLAALLVATIGTFAVVHAENPYRFFTWNVTYGDIYPLGVRQQVCLFFFFLFFETCYDFFYQKNVL